MGNRVYLELRGADPSILLPEEDEEATARLACNNGLPLFWLALTRPTDLGGTWEAEVRAAFADPDGGGTIEPLRLSWPIAAANLDAACARADRRLPELAPVLRAWRAGLLALAGQGPSEEVRLCLAEYANFHADADAFLDELRRGARAWHGAEPPVLPPITDPGQELTGFDWLTDRPFPAFLPAWRPGRPVPGAVEAFPGSTGPSPAPGRIPGPLAEWAMVALLVLVTLGAALLGGALLGPSGRWPGGVLGFVAGAVLVWRWARWTTSRR